MLQGKRAPHGSPDSSSGLGRVYAWRWSIAFGGAVLVTVVACLAAIQGLIMQDLFPVPIPVSVADPTPIDTPDPLAWPALLAVHLALFLGLIVAVAGYSPRVYLESGPGLANLVTFLRAVLALPLLAAILLPGLQTEPIVAFLVAVAGLAVVLDGLDGWLARRLDQSSAFGARFDMEVDAFLILLLSILVWQTGQTGAWVLWIGLLRYFFVAAGWYWTWLQAPLFASRRRQAICVLQSVILLFSLLPFVPAPWPGILAGAALLALVYSFAFDTIWLFRRRLTSQSAQQAKSRSQV
jgi:phosphatidylglycerophosphate synthase